jgi:hypothetical protein
MTAWSNWVGKFCFIAALAVPIALSGASLPVSAQDQQDPQQLCLTCFVQCSARATGPRIESSAPATNTEANQPIKKQA